MAQQSVPGDGPPVTGSEGYRDAGADGSGIKIAIIDNGFDSLLIAQANGDAPGVIQDSVSFLSGGIMTGTSHGTKVLEIIYDHAPGATYYLYRVGSLYDASDFQGAVSEAIANDVNIISMSITFHNQGWEDNTGGACAAAEQATNASILVFAAAGNSGVQHWLGSYYDPDGDNIHNWEGVDEHNDISAEADETLRAFLQWDTGGTNTNYDLYLYDSPKTTILAQGTHSGENYDTLTYTSPIDQTVKIRVVKISGGSTDLQLFVRGHSGVSNPIQFYTSEGSITSPSNSTKANLVSVGAVDVDYFDTLPGTSGIIKIYSSQGPTLSDNTKPDLCSPTDCLVSITGSTFGGTSCATPNAAGTAAAFWSSAPYLHASGVRYLLYRMANIFKDWGDSGFDNIYGRGGIALYTFHLKTYWIDRDAGNLSGLSELPYYYVDDAESAAQSGGRIVFLSDHYPEPVVLEKNLLYESIGGSAVLGM
jgi:hypothetical protein